MTLQTFNIFTRIKQFAAKEKRVGLESGFQTMEYLTLPFHHKESFLAAF